MKFLLIAVEVIVGLLLIGVVLLQRSKDQGLGLAFGAGMGESLFGSQAVNVLIKITVILSCVFFLNTMILARLMRSQATSVRAVPLEEQRRGGVPARSKAPAGETQSATPESKPIGNPVFPVPAEPLSPVAPAAGSESAGTVLPPAEPAPVAP